VIPSLGKRKAPGAMVMVIGSGMVGVGKVKYPYSYREAFAAAVTIGLLGAKVKSERGKPGPKQRDGSCEI